MQTLQGCKNLRTILDELSSSDEDPFASKSDYEYNTDDENDVISSINGNDTEKS
jgi:hypothetical protein